MAKKTCKFWCLKDKNSGMDIKNEKQPEEMF